LDANSNPVWRAEMAEKGTLLGFPFKISDQIPENLGGGANESEVYFGDFADLLITMFGETRVDATTEGAYDDAGTLRSTFSRDETAIRVIAAHDLTQRHDGAFSVIQAVIWV
jgi:HK97 family phage major capsid protein